MGNKPAKEEKIVRGVDQNDEREDFLLNIVPPVDRAYMKWLCRDLERIHGFTPKRIRAVRPPDHYVEFMKFNGWLDVNLDDPDLAHLFK